MAPARPPNPPPPPPPPPIIPPIPPPPPPPEDEEPATVPATAGLDLSTVWTFFRPLPSVLVAVRQSEVRQGRIGCRFQVSGFGYCDFLEVD
jgi:hypothetical protein